MLLVVVVVVLLDAVDVFMEDDTWVRIVLPTRTNGFLRSSNKENRSWWWCDGGGCRRSIFFFYLGPAFKTVRPSTPFVTAKFSFLSVFRHEDIFILEPDGRDASNQVWSIVAIVVPLHSLSLSPLFSLSVFAPFLLLLLLVHTNTHTHTSNGTTKTRHFGDDKVQRVRKTKSFLVGRFRYECQCGGYYQTVLPPFVINNRMNHAFLVTQNDFWA